MAPPPFPLDDVLKRVFHDTPGVLSAYLFGSVARGRPHRESDIDIGALLDWTTYPTRPQRFEARVRLIAQLGSALHRNDVDLLILNDAPPHLAREIVTRGRRIFCRHGEADHAFVRTAMLRAADLEPFLRRARRVKLAALER
jgi:predicted nucleotidyltransferase